MSTNGLFISINSMVPMNSFFLFWWWLHNYASDDETSGTHVKDLFANRFRLMIQRRINLSLKCQQRIVTNIISDIIIFTCLSPDLSFWNWSIGHVHRCAYFDPKGLLCVNIWALRYQSDTWHKPRTNNRQWPIYPSSRLKQLQTQSNINNSKLHDIYDTWQLTMLLKSMLALFGMYDLLAAALSMSSIPNAPTDKPANIKSYWHDNQNWINSQWQW